jgi:hypothetical protein
MKTQKQPAATAQAIMAAADNGLKTMLRTETDYENVRAYSNRKQ